MSEVPVEVIVAAFQDEKGADAVLKELKQAKRETLNIDDPNRAEGEHEPFVRVEWIKTVPLEEAVVVKTKDQISLRVQFIPGKADSISVEVKSHNTL